MEDVSCSYVTPFHKNARFLLRKIVENVKNSAKNNNNAEYEM